MHALSRLDRDTAGVERDALANQYQVLVGPAAGRLPDQFQQPRWARRATTDRQHSPEAVLGQPILVAHDRPQPGHGGGQAGGGAGEPGGILGPARSVGKVPGQPGGPAEQLRPGDGLGKWFPLLTGRRDERDDFDPPE